MEKRRSNGEGSIFQPKNSNKWVYSYRENGKRTTLYFNSEKEAKEARNKKIAGKLKNSTNVTLGELIKEYVESKHDLGLVNDNTYITDCATLNRLQHFDILEKSVCKIQTEDIIDLLSKTRKWSQSTIKKNYSLLKNGFALAVSKEYLQNNPMNSFKVKQPRSSKKHEDVRGFTVEEQEKFCKCANLLKDTYKYKNIWLLALYTGMRTGEILALTINDINFKNGYIDVNNTLTKGKNKKTALGDTTKTYSGLRKITINQITNSILNIAMKNYIPNKEKLIFTRENGSLMTVEMSNSAFRRFCKRNKIIDAPKINQHLLRHTYATRCIESGMPAHVLKKQLGHKSIDTTLDDYADIFDKYENSYNENLEKYYKENNLLLSGMIDTNFVIQNDIKNIISMIENSHFTQKVKDKLLEDIEMIKKVYEFAI